MKRKDKHEMKKRARETKKERKTRHARMDYRCIPSKQEPTLIVTKSWKKNRPGGCSSARIGGN